jgi:hypothetical protein
MIRCFALMLLCMAHAPMLAAGLLAIGGLNGDHEIRCSFGDAALEITLHHRQEKGIGEANPHRHNWAERLLLKENFSENQQDHHFGCTRQSVISDEEGLRLDAANLTAWTLPLAFELIDFEILPLTETTLLKETTDVSGLSPPQRVRRGVVMRV